MSNPKIIMTDEDLDGKLQLFCYDYCNNQSSNEVKQSRGLIYKNGKPFLKSFGFTPQYTLNDINVINNIKENFNKLSFFDSYEGTLLRLFYNDINDKWYLSTHRKLNADKSKWGSNETFGEKFRHIIPENFYSNLNKEYNYMFLLTPNQYNRIVCNTINMILHIGTYDKDFNLTTEYNIGIPSPAKHNFNNFEEFIDFIENKIDITKTQGLIIHNPETQSNIKIYSNKYYEYYKIRDNVPSVKFRYLQLRNNIELTNKLKELYPIYIKDFEEYEKILDITVDKIFENYMNRFVKKIFTTVIPEENTIMKLCHKWHNINKSINKVSKNKVKEILNKQDPCILNKFIKINKQN